MTDNKKRISREARAKIMLMISDVSDERKQELINQYKIDEPVTTSETIQKVLIGNWHNNAAKMLLRGATEEELTKVVEHIIVLIYLRKYNLDFKRSFKDRDLISLARKYFDKNETVEVKLTTPEERKEQIKKREAYREAMKQKVLAMRDEGLSIADISEKLNMPESTIRALAEGK